MNFNMGINVDSFFLIMIFLLLIVGLTIPFSFFGIFRGRKQLTRVKNRLLKRDAQFQEFEKKNIKTLLADSHQHNESLTTSLKEGLAKLTDATPSEEDLAQFYTDFEKVYPHFFSAIGKVLPKSTQNELRLCILIRLNLSSKEIARLLNITPESVNKARYRLRKKLKLSPNDELHEFLINI